MGQRHQIFLRVHNPVKNTRLFEDKGEKAKAKKAFGNGKYTVIALHHQWLYGRSAAVNILNMLLYTNLDTMASYTNPFDKEFYQYNGHGGTLESHINKIMGILQVQSNILHPRGIGFENMHFLNDGEPEMRYDFTLGDNDDGITIIDTITRKYCMMNFSDYYDANDKDALGSASCLPPMVPVSASDYMAAYYGETEDTLQDYYKENKTPEQIKEILLENKLENHTIALEIHNQSKGVLTEKELKKIFPKFYKTYIPKFDEFGTPM